MYIYNKKNKYDPLVVKIDIKKFDRSLRYRIIDNLNKAEMFVNLKSFEHDTELLSIVLHNTIDYWANNNMLSTALTYYEKSLKTPELKKELTKAVCNFLDDLQNNKKSYQLGSDIPKTLEACMVVFEDDAIRQKALKTIISKNGHFYSYARKSLALTAAKLAKSDSDLLEVVNTFYKIMEKDAFCEIINKISNGIDNPGIKKILAKTKKFNVCKYTKAEVKYDSAKRVELLKDIARSPTSAKNLNFSIKFTLEDLEKVAPVMRFKFFEWYFKERFSCVRRYFSRPDKYKENIKNRLGSSMLSKIELPSLSEEQLRIMLFSVGLKKNSEASNFIERYKLLKKIESGVALLREDIRVPFGYSYYW